jgi:hypothetical protein
MNVINTAINITNEANARMAVSEATGLVNQIHAVSGCINNNRKQIDRFRNDLLAINGEEVSVKSVLGTDLPTTSNTETITKVVEDLNKGRQDEVKMKSTRLTQAIASLMETNEQLVKQLGELRVKLAAIKPVVVTEGEITGTAHSNS